MVFNHGFWRYDCRAKEEVLQDPLSFCLDLTFYMAIARHAMKLIYGQTDRSATIYLKRLSMGPLTLDPSLEPGEYRRLTSDEIKELKSI